MEGLQQEDFKRKLKVLKLLKRLALGSHGRFQKKIESRPSEVQRLENIQRNEDFKRKLKVAKIANIPCTIGLTKKISKEN